jgi:hypothetical protein
MPLYFDSATYDRATGILTVKTITPSRASWSKDQYRDVPAALVAQMQAAAPHEGEFIRERVAPFYESRRTDQGVWHPPVAPDPEWLQRADASGAVRRDADNVREWGR